jgi:hypothetical protein
MTREQVINLLKAVRANYPNAKIDAAGMVEAWLLCFGSYDPEPIYMAARVHMERCSFFPTVHDILKNINRGQMLYGTPAPVKTIEAPKKDITADICAGSCICPYFDAVCFGTPEEQKVCKL